MSKGYFKNGRKFANRKFMAVKKNAAVAAIICFIGVAMLFQQCKHEPILRKHGNTPTDTTTPKPTPEDTTICFERDILPLFVTNCAKSGCHDSTTQEEDLMLNSYYGIRYAKAQTYKDSSYRSIRAYDTAASKLFQAITNPNYGGGEKYMNKPGYGNLRPSEIALIKRWIMEGAPDGKNCPSKCDTAIFTYSKADSAIISKYCYSCHSGNSPSGGAAFDNYTNIKSFLDKKKDVFWNRVNAFGGTSIMPPKGKLESCKLTQLKKWIDAGYKNN